MSAAADTAITIPRFLPYMIMLAATTKITDIFTGKTFTFIGVLALIRIHNVNKYFKNI